jgi:RNA polymerase sigma-70 factor (ECF subfamily)
MASDSPHPRLPASRPGAGELDALFQRALPRVLAYVRVRLGPRLRGQESSLDLVQSACREVLEDLPAEGFRDETGFRRWLCLAAERKILDRARYHARDRRDAARVVPLSSALSDLEVRSLAEAWSSLESPSHAASLREDVERVEKALAALPDDYREVVVLAYLLDLPHAEIAARMGRQEGAVRVLLHRALARLAREVGCE